MGQALSPYEMGARSLDALIQWASDHAGPDRRNEATTRLHLIDQLLFDCLGWPKDACVAEENYERTYVDYALGVPMRRLVVEAKREGIYFELPAGFDSQTMALGRLIEDSPGIRDAIVQAVTYCQQRGTPIGAVSNGNQLIAFIGSRQDGVPPLEGSALIYPSLEAMRERFRELWDNLSEPGVLAFNIRTTLGAARVTPPPERLAERLIKYPGYKGRNPLAQGLGILGELVIEDISRAPELQEDFVRSCYSSSGALSEYALVSRGILTSRYSLLFEDSGIQPHSAMSKSGLAPELTSDLVAASLARRTVLLLGDVGVGKTMFLRHLISVDVQELLERSIVLYIDFLEQPALATELSRFIYAEFTRQLYVKYGVDVNERNFVRGVYHGELERFSRGVHSDLRESDSEGYLRAEIKFLERKVGDDEEHLRESLNHVSKAQKRQVIVILDNIDQRPFDFQEQLFPIAESLAQSWPMVVFLSMRPETFYRSKAEGTIRAYQPRVFTISPPRVDRVISKRLRWAFKLLEGEGRLPSFPEQFTVSGSAIAQYLEVLRTSFDRNEALGEFVENMCGGNIRRALSFLTAFIGSGHVDTIKILAAVEESGSYLVPLHEFMRAVIYGDHRYYYPPASPVPNLLDISVPDPREHFLLPMILEFVERSGGDFATDLSVPTGKIFEFAQQVGFSPSQIEFALARARDKELLDFAGTGGEGATSTKCRITTIGAYGRLRLLGSFAYLDAIIVDLPIVDADVRSQISDAQSVNDRLHRAETVVDYLDECWRPLDGADVGFSWPEASFALRDDIRKAREGKERRAARG